MDYLIYEETDETEKLSDDVDGIGSIETFGGDKYLSEGIDYGVC